MPEQLCSRRPQAQRMLHLVL
uniref:Pco128311 n=1 Tax=Arundo donax TaxID=35708 RepID=A0A0A9EB84_ARUDO